MKADPVIGFRLSPLQAHAWPLLTRGAGSALRVDALIAGRGRLDVAGVVKALEAVARDYEILRTSFTEVRDGVVLQCVSDTADVSVKTLRCDWWRSPRRSAFAWSSSSKGNAQTDVRRLCEAVLVSVSGAPHRAPHKEPSGESPRDCMYLGLSPLVADRRTLWLLARALMDRWAGRASVGAPPSSGSRAIRRYRGVETCRPRLGGCRGGPALLGDAGPGLERARGAAVHAADSHDGSISARTRAGRGRVVAGELARASRRQ